MSNEHAIDDLEQLAADIKRWGRELGFQQLGISDTDLTLAEKKLEQWLPKVNVESIQSRN